MVARGGAIGLGLPGRRGWTPGTTCGRCPGLDGIGIAFFAVLFFVCSLVWVFVCLFFAVPH